MSDTLPWNNDEPLSISQLLKQSMRSVDTLVSNTSLLDKMSTHLNGLLRTEEPEIHKAIRLFDGMFTQASNAMETDSDKQVLDVLKRQVSSFIGITLGVKPFLEQRESSELDDEDNKLSWSSAQEKETNGAWQDQKEYHERHQSDIYAPEHAEQARLMLEEEQYGQGAHHGESAEEGDSESGESEYEDVVERVAIKSREIGGAGGFEVVHRRQKKKKTKTTITTNFSYDYNRSDSNQQQQYYNRPPRHQVRVCEFRPKRLEHLSDDAYCMPVFFPSEDSYSVFHSALSSAQETLFVCVFSLTDNDTADVLINAHKRGVNVKIITDNDQMDSCKGADVVRLNEQFGIPYKKDNSDQFMHNKFAVIDNKKVITGSFNWSAGARYKNRENIIVTNIPSVVQSYAEEFERLWRFF